MARPSTRRTWPLTRARPPPRSSIRRVMTSNVRQAPCVRCSPSMAGSTSAPSVSMLCSIRCCSCGRSASSRASAPLRSRFGNFEPVADRMQALQRHVVGVIAAFAGVRGPVDERVRAGCRGLSAACSSSICCGISSQMNRRSRSMGIRRRPTERPSDEKQRAGDSRSCSAREKFLDRLVRKVAGGDDVRQRLAGQAADAPALGQVDFEEGAVLARRVCRTDAAP